MTLEKAVSTGLPCRIIGRPGWWVIFKKREEYYIRSFSSPLASGSQVISIGDALSDQWEVKRDDWKEVFGCKVILDNTLLPNSFKIQ